ncbi:NAD(P)-binding protein [Xylariaceae sp. FL0662B]|nr:NAD(P)-binding protein [Xylariaceae sp. FL0662B]
MADTTTLTPRPQTKTAFVTGANGYIGLAVCRAFVRAGYRTYGLIRRPESASTLTAEEVIPIVGSISAEPGFLEALYQQADTFDVIVSCTEQLPFGGHYEHILGVLQQLADTSNRHGVRPLVLFSSGCKDYGTTDVHGAPGLAPHTEDSPLRPAHLIRERASSSLRIFDHADRFDAAVLRPTPLFGYSSSYYGLLFELAAAAAAAKGGGSGSLDIPADFNTILHGCHVDDCAAAYLALAEHPDRRAVAGQCFNVSAHRYETLGEIAAALAQEYDLPGGVRPAAPGAEASFHDVVYGYSQWVDSGKIRRLTGWRDKRMLFSENLHAYRLAYEEAARRGDEGVVRTKERIDTLVQTPVEGQ